MLSNCGVGEDSWESLGLQGDPTSPSKGNQSWIFIGRTDVEAETPILWAPDVQNWLIGKDPDAGQDWRQEEKGTTEDEISGWMASLAWWTWVWPSSPELVIPSNHLIPFSSCLLSFPASGCFPVSQFFTSGGQSIGVSASASVLPMNIQDWFPLGLTGLFSLQS